MKTAPVDSSAALPAHAQVAGRIVSLLREKGLKPGNRMPSERDLSQQLGVPHPLARQAILLLGQDNQLERRVGAGTFLRADIDSLESSLGQWLNKRNTGRDKAALGVILLATRDAFLSEILKELHRVAAMRGTALMIRTADPDYVGLMRATQQLAYDGCSSVLLPQLEGLTTADIVRFTLDSKLPVSLPRHIAGLESVFFESPKDYGIFDRAVIALSAAYLRELGKSDLAYFGPLGASGDCAGERVQAFATCASNHDLKVRFALLPATPEALDVLLLRWQHDGPPEGVCCYDDEHALRLLSAAQRLGIKVPDGMAVIGVNDVPLAAHACPTLTTIHFDYAYVAEGLVDHALMHAGISVPVADHPKSLTLVIRQSCGGKRIDAGQLAPRLSAACGMLVRISSF